ncbi:uncharacterized protein NEMAJ01_0391 [Nematocida major]|uniref:uncharacterized protein n=1 Tax=Nematocida major TaxID=1912982 RepID=UPI002007A9CB|nr:uncharacterized protein NEMAJ01_0391 [Nematocida major]KAH9385495.1 hypothetical protein NEMAJ01_0391 [Nematocida major]
MKISLLPLLFGLAKCLRAPSQCSKPGQIALVFSDGPVETSPDLVQTLADQGIAATFMFSTVNIDHPGVSNVIRQAVDEGHTVGLRTNPIYDFSEMNETEIREAIVGELNVLDEVSGQKTKYISINQPDVMNQTVLQVIEDLDLILINYNYDMYGSSDDDQDDMLNRWKLKLKSVRPQSSSYIVLQHDQRESELGIVPEVVDMGSAAGYSFVNIEDCLSGVSMDGPAGAAGAGSSSDRSERTGTDRKNSAMSPILLMGCMSSIFFL